MKPPSCPPCPPPRLITLPAWFESKRSPLCNWNHWTRSILLIVLPEQEQQQNTLQTSVTSEQLKQSLGSRWHPGNMSVLQAWIAQATGLYERARIAQSIKSNATSENETVNRDLYGKLINTN